MSEYQYERLHDEGWPELQEIFRDLGKQDRCPSPIGANVRVARHEGKIVGFLVGQFVRHAEPLWIHPDHRGKVSWLRMLNDLDHDFGTCFVFAPDERIENLCHAAGLEELPWKVFVKGESCHS